MSQAPFASKVIPGPLREVLLLEGALRSVEARSADQLVKIRELATGVDARLAAAQPLASGDQAAPALVILREAAHLAALAVLADRDAEGASLGGEDALDRVAKLAADGSLADAPPDFASVCELLCSPNRLVFDEMQPTDAANGRLEAEKSVRWLRELVEPRSAAQLKRSRTLRLVSAVLLLLGAFGGLLAWGAFKILSPINVAHGKPVHLSSRRPACGTTNAEGLPPSGLVDGSKSGGYDICTNAEVGPWAIVDFGQVFTLSNAKVYGRDDCCWGLYDLPTVFEISVDGKVYTEVARQTTSYSAVKPWNVTIGGRRARFVRLRVDSREVRELVLCELEVFGRSH